MRWQSRTGKIAQRATTTRALALETMVWGARRLFPITFQIEGRPQFEVWKDDEGLWVGVERAPSGSLVCHTPAVATPHEAAALLGKKVEPEPLAPAAQLEQAGLFS